MPTETAHLRAAALSTGTLCSDMAWHHWALLAKAGVWGGLTLALPQTVAASCPEGVISAQAAHLRTSSEWHEFDAALRNLVTETGTLSGAELSISYPCHPWHWAAALSELNGSTRYDGQTSNGSRVVSQSVIGQRQGRLQAHYALAEHWQVGARLLHQTISRDIASAGGATGYPELYDWTTLAVGAQWQASLGPGTLTVAAWSARPVQSSLLVKLPGRDPAKLPLGSIRQFDLNLGWRTQLSPAWHLQAEVGWQRTEIDEGSQAVITRNGFPTGVAHQPRLTTLSRPIALRLEFGF